MKIQGLDKSHGHVCWEHAEITASFLSRLTFGWVDSIMFKGFKKPLVFDDLCYLNPDDKSAEVIPKFEKHWANTWKATKRSGEGEFKLKNSNQNESNNQNQKKISILPVLAKTIWKIFLFGSALKLLSDTVIFANPQILGLIIGYVHSNEPQWMGIVYAFILFISASTRTIVQNHFFKIMVSVGIRIRCAAVSAIYKKVLRLSNIASKERTVGEIINLVALDSQRLLELPILLTSLWSFPLQIFMAIYFLWKELGPSILAGISVMILLIPINILVGRKLKTMEISRIKIQDKRLKQMNEILNGIKVLKLYAWEASFEKRIRKIRQEEVKLLTKAAYLKAGNNFIWNYAPFIVALVTFATYVLIDENNILDANKAFVSLALLNILKGPLYQLPMEINNLIQFFVSVKRINDFMGAEELDPDNVSHNWSETDSLVIQQGRFSWGEQPILKNINLQIKKNNLIAVLGAVGSGKSSLLSAFLGEMNKVSGNVNTVGSVAYVPQLAWIQNATLKDNILFGREFDEQLYEKVVYACALKPDLKMLSDGDQTEIGEKGINLSGGQKQRISLARAVYSKSDIYFLDDPLSAVDSHVGKHIFEKVIGPQGLLKNKTRVLVTHAVTYLPKVDNVLMLQDGILIEFGSYKELLNKNGAFADFLMEHIQDTVENKEEFRETEKQLIGAPIKDCKFVRKRLIKPRKNGSLTAPHYLISQTSVENSKRMHVEHKERILKIKKRRDIKLIRTESAETGSVKRNVYKQYVSAVGILITVTTVIMNITSQGFAIGTNLWLGTWAESSNVSVNGTADTSTRNTYLEVYALLGLGEGISALIANVLLAKGTMHAAITLHHYVLKNVMRLPMSFFDITPSGRILARFSSDIAGVDVTLPSDVNQFIQNFSKVIGILMVISYVTPTFIAVLIPATCLFLLMQRYYVSSSRQINRLLSISRSPVYSHLSETLSGAHIIRAFCQQDRFILQSQKKVDENHRCFYNNNMSSRWLAIRLETIGNLLLLFVTLFAVLGQTLLPAMVGLSINYTLQVTAGMMWLVLSTSNLESNMVSVERLKEYGQLAPEAPWEIADTKPPAAWPKTGKIEYTNYAVPYRPGLKLILKDLNFKVGGGEKIGIVGRTGAGKSTLTLSLFRIIEAAQGVITIDGVDVSKIGLHALRSNITIIPQDAVLFSGSLRMNLDPLDTYSDEELLDSLEQAHLKEFVKSIPAALHHQVSEGGKNLSMGQRQLICLARALLRKTKLLILDEATAAIDLETDDLIQKTIRREFKDCTVLTIAHRLNTIMDSDRVLVMDQGQIAEFDTPGSLLQNQNSILYAMCKDAKLI